MHWHPLLTHFLWALWLKDPPGKKLPSLLASVHVVCVLRPPHCSRVVTVLDCYQSDYAMAALNMKLSDTKPKGIPKTS